MPSPTFAARAYGFYTRLKPPAVPRGVTVMNPYAEPRVRRYLKAFLDGHFADDSERVLVLGINPGRFGAGVTGVTFTDPVALADLVGIPNDLPRRRELSSVFIYDFIDRFGGPRDFYRRFFLSAVSPLGFTRGGNNLNYYDEPPLARSVTPFITTSLERQLALGCSRRRVVVLGLGQNWKFLERLNQERGFFDEILPLEHPRWIMQYRRRRMKEYLQKYLEVFARAASD
jgi:hypothetical protein